EGKRRAGWFITRLEHISLHEEDIKIAIIVVVKEGAARTHDLRQEELSVHTIVVPERQANFFCDFFKDCLCWWSVFPGRLEVCCRVGWSEAKPSRGQKEEQL